MPNRSLNNRSHQFHACAEDKVNKHHNCCFAKLHIATSFDLVTYFEKLQEKLTPTLVLGKLVSLSFRLCSAFIPLLFVCLVGWFCWSVGFTCVRTFFCVCTNLFVCCLRYVLYMSFCETCMLFFLPTSSKSYELYLLIVQWKFNRNVFNGFVLAYLRLSAGFFTLNVKMSST